MEEKVILTDEQVDEIIKTAETANEGNESINQLKEAKAKSVEELIDDIDVKDKNVSLSINPSTGETEGVTVPDKGYGFERESDLFTDFDEELNPSTEVDRDFTDSQIKRVMQHGKDGEQDRDNEEELTLEDINQMRQLLIKKGEKGTIKYNDIPDALKPRIDETIRRELGRGEVRDERYKMARNMLANSIVNEIQLQIVSEKISDVCVDLNTSIKNLIKNEYADIYSGQHKQEMNTFISKMPELAETKYADDPKKKELLLAVSNGYKQAHSLEEMYDAYIHGGKKMKIRHIDLEDIGKVIRNFEMKYEKSNLTIRDLGSTVDVLSRFVNSRFTEKIIKGFIIVFCKYTSSMNPRNIDEHTFMYYFINNILSLDVPTNDNDDMEWRNEFLDNVNHFMALIADVIGV